MITEGADKDEFPQASTWPLKGCNRVLLDLGFRVQSDILLMEEILHHLEPLNYCNS